MTTSIESINSTTSRILVNGVESLKFDSSGGLTASSINGGQFAGFRNRIINGACNIAQRSNISCNATTTNGYGGPDRFGCWNNAAGGQFTQSASAMTYNGVLLNTVRQTVDIGTTSFGTTNYWYGIHQFIEGYNSYRLKGKALSISFIFNTNLAGTYSVSLRDSGATNSYVTSFTIAANVPTRIAIQVPTVPLTANIPASNAWGLDVVIGFLNQSNWQTSVLNSWQAGDKISAAGATIWSATAGNFIELTQLQLEEGTMCTPFEQRDITIDVILCQRYYEVIIGTNAPSSPQYNHHPYKVVKRTSSPTLIVLSGSLAGADIDAGGGACSFRTPSGILATSTSDFVIGASAEF
jgi:hypothetical protein